ncbi:MAG: methyl-accepting chemotaxis protein [Deltaproteobacteria bacterium]|nr:methyl-accepting chemotaxis protein [Deltaproteobacteria bacterium]
MDDLRLLLHQLADRLADRASVALPAIEPVPEALPSAAELSEEHVFLRAFFDAVVEGDLSARLPAASDPLVQRGEETLERLRTLLRSARESTEGVGLRADTIVDAIEHAASAGNQQRIILDHAMDEMRPLLVRLNDLQHETAEITTSCDRIALLALNTGIEGLRVGGEVARALSTLGDEIRRLAVRSSLTARELGEALKSTGESAKRGSTNIEEARAMLRHIADEVTRAASSAESVRIADETLRDATAGFRVLDIESEELLLRLDDTATRLADELVRAGKLAQRNVAGSEDVRAAVARIQKLVAGEHNAR